MNKVFEENS